MTRLLADAQRYLQKLCLEIPGRSVGSEGNRMATSIFRDVVTAANWLTEIDAFDAMDWVEGVVVLSAGGQEFRAHASPYSNACNVKSRLVCIRTVDQLAGMDISAKAVLLHGEIAREQLMPKNFVFYNPEEHQRIISLLEKGAPSAIICATGRNVALAGGVYPFPLIEDGDFDIPSVFMTEEEGQRLLSMEGEIIILNSDCRRLPGKGYNVIARRGNPAHGRIVVSAHIDAKKGTPGAIDNATGVVVLLLLADLLRDHSGTPMVELAAFNGEDYYAVPGQMCYLRRNEGHFDKILFNINMDGAGFKEGNTAFSFYQLPEAQEREARRVLTTYAGIEEGSQWYQGDHSIFIQQGCPAIAITSAWFSKNIDNQDITHTPKDNLQIVEPARLVEIAKAISSFIRAGKIK